MKIGIIGYGNLGKALVQGLLCSGVTQADIVVTARTEKTRSIAHEEFKDICVTDSKEELVEKTDVIILVVEPKNSEKVLKELGTYDISGKIIISFMAGITITEIKNMLGEQQDDLTIMRVMPNIAISNGNGVLGVTYDEADYEKVKEFFHLLEKLGCVLRMDEEELEYITVTAASGLAFVASLMNSYQKASNMLLQDEEKSKEITIRTFENALALVKSKGCSFETLIESITTKGGTTEAGMKCLKQDLITETLQECVTKSFEKARNIL